jgi:hypothetical protein
MKENDQSNGQLAKEIVAEYGPPTLDTSGVEPDASFAAPAGQPLTPADFRVTLTVERIGMVSTSGTPVATDAITVQEWAPWATAPEVREAITNAFRRSVVAVQGAWLS